MICGVERLQSRHLDQYQFELTDGWCRFPGFVTSWFLVHAWFSGPFSLYCDHFDCGADLPSQVKMQYLQI